jgi:membrane dipeptidase
VFDLQELDEFAEGNRAAFPGALGYSVGIRMVAPEQIPEIVEGLLARGYGDADVESILGGNWLRIASTVWR